MRYAGIFAIWLCASVALGGETVDKTLDTAKQIHEGALRKAEGDLQRAQQKFAKDKADADQRLLLVYDEAIKRVTQRGDLEGANRLLAEKKALESGVAAAPPADAGGALPDAPTLNLPKLNWISLPKDAVPPALILVDIPGEGEDESDYVNFFLKAEKNGKVHDHKPVPIKANADGVFKGPGPKNIDTNYYAFYLRAEAATAASMTIRMAEYGKLKMWVDGNEVHGESVGPKEKREKKYAMDLSRGPHVIVIRHRTDWAGNWFQITQLEGGKLQTAG